MHKHIDTERRLNVLCHIEQLTCYMLKEVQLLHAVSTAACFQGPPLFHRLDRLYQGRSQRP